MNVHPTAIVSPETKMAEDVVILAYCVVGPGVSIGSGTVIGPHVVIEGKTAIGARNRVHPFVSIGLPPQDLTYRDEETEVVIGDDNIIRENVTIHRGTARGAGATRVGDRNFLMAGSHIAHDCQVGSDVVMANLATLGGHAHVGDHASIGGLAAVHQMVRVGAYSFIGGVSGVRMDIPPYMLAQGADGARLHGPNVVGLKRAGFSPESITAIRRSFKIIFRSGLIVADAVARVREEVQSCPEVETLLDFILSPSKRGMAR